MIFAYFRWFSGLFGKQHSHVLISFVKVGAAKTSAHKPQFWALPYISYISHSPRKRGRRLSPPVLVSSCSTGHGVPYQRGPKGKLESWMLCTLVFYWFRTPITCRWIYSTPPKTEKCLTPSWAGCCFSIYMRFYLFWLFSKLYYEWYLDKKPPKNHGNRCPSWGAVDAKGQPKGGSDPGMEMMGGLAGKISPRSPRNMGQIMVSVQQVNINESMLILCHIYHLVI